MGNEKIRAMTPEEKAAALAQMGLPEQPAAAEASEEATPASAEVSIESLQARLEEQESAMKAMLLQTRLEAKETEDAAEKIAARNDVLEHQMKTLRQSTAAALDDARKRVCDLEYHGQKRASKLEAKLQAAEGQLARGERTSVLSSVVEAIGETPVIDASRLLAKEGLTGQLLLKLEMMNPGCSKKDRIAKEMIEEAVAAGELQPGQTVVELTSGNTGTGLAIVCGISGHPFIAVMSCGNSRERAVMMRALGAEVVLVAQHEDSTVGQVSGADLDLVRETAEKLTEERGAFRADQFTHRGNRLAHSRHTGPELVRQCGGKLDAFVDFVGSGGTLGGCSDALRDQIPTCQCFGVEPDGVAVLAGLEVTNASHRIQGGGYEMAELEPLGDTAQLAGLLQVNDQEAIRVARLLAETEGIFGGFSGGANAAAALQLLRQPEFAGKRVAAIVCDSGLKYLSTDLWEAVP